MSQGESGALHWKADLMKLNTKSFVWIIKTSLHESSGENVGRQQVEKSFGSSALKIIDETIREEIESSMIIKRNHNE